MEGPDSSYSLLAIHICWKVDRLARMEPPIQTLYLRSGGATTYRMHSLLSTIQTYLGGFYIFFNPQVWNFVMPAQYLGCLAPCRPLHKAVLCTHQAQEGQQSSAAIAASRDRCSPGSGRWCSAP